MPRGELLQYHPHPAPAGRRWLLLPLRLLPLVMAVATLGLRDFDSDPPTLEQFCALWCAAVCGYAGWFLHRLNEHPVAGHFRSVWFD